MAAKAEKLWNDLYASSSSSSLSVIEICDEYIKDDGCAVICDRLRLVPSVNTVDLKGNDIKERGCQLLAELIVNAHNIRKLKLEWNLIGLQNALPTLCRGLLSSNICHLDLRNNKIDSGGGKIIGAMLHQNKRLQHLDLRWNNLGMAGGQCVLEMLQSRAHATLQTLLLSGNQIPVQILRSIDSALKHSAVIQSRESPSVSTRNSTITQSPTNSAAAATTENQDLCPHKSVPRTTTGFDDTIQEKNETIEHLQAEINEIFAGKTSLNEECERLKLRVAELESENLDFKDKQDILEAGKRTSEQELAALRESSAAEKQTCLDKIRGLEVTNDEQCQSREDDKKEFDNVRESLSNQNGIEVTKLRDSKDVEINKWRKSANELHIQLNELKTKNNSLRSELLQNEMANERKYIEFEKNIREQCNDTLSAKIRELEQNLQSLRKSRDALECEMKSEKEKYEQCMHRTESEKQQFQQWLNEEQQKKCHLEAAKRNLNSELQKHHNVIVQKNQQIESLKIGLQETEKSIQSLESEQQSTMKRVLSEHNRQILTLEKSLRECQQTHVIVQHRKRNLELRVGKMEDDEQRKICAVHDAIKCLANAFEIYDSPLSTQEIGEQKENRELLTSKSRKSTHSIVMTDNAAATNGKRQPATKTHRSSNDNDDDDETFIEFVEDDNEEIVLTVQDEMDESMADYMLDHSTFNKKKRKDAKSSNKKKTAKTASKK